MLRLISRNVIPADTVENSSHMIEALRFGMGVPLDVHFMEGNRRPTSGNYICVVKIWDYWRLSADRCREAGVQHFSDSIEAELIKDVIDRKAILIFDLSNEGPEFESKFFDEIHQFAHRHSLPLNRIIWLAQNRRIEADYYKHYGQDRANSIAFEYYDFYIKLMAHWFASPDWRHSRIGSDHEYARLLMDPNSKTHIALCLNATSRKHRVLTLSKLRNMGLLGQCLASFGGVDYPKGHPLETDSLLAEFSTSGAYSYLVDDARAILTGGRIVIDSFEDFGNQLVDKIDASKYINSFFSIVTETDFTDGFVTRITEKLAKICCLGHPFVNVGNPHSLDFIEGWGFQSFSDVIDQRYDKVADPEARFRLLFQSVAEIHRELQKDPKEWLGRADEISRYNIQHSRGGFLYKYTCNDERVLLESLARRLEGSADH